MLPAIQLLAITITAGVYANTSGFKWLIVVYIFAFSHYIVGAWYSRQAAKALLVSPKSYLPLALMSLCGVLAYAQSFSLLLYFGVHHALSESYLTQRNYKILLSGETLSKLQNTRFWFHLSAYILLLRNDGLFTYDMLLLPALFIAAGSAFLLLQSFRLSKQTLGQSQLITAYAGECVLLIALFVSLLYDFTFLQVVFYHFTIWAIIPMLSMRLSATLKPVSIYILLTAATLILFTFLSPYGEMNLPKFKRFQDWFVVLSYAHITISFALSSANPQWITGLFNVNRATP